MKLRSADGGFVLVARTKRDMFTDFLRLDRQKSWQERFVGAPPTRKGASIYDFCRFHTISQHSAAQQRPSVHPAKTSEG